MCYHVIWSLSALRFLAIISIPFFIWQCGFENLVPPNVYESCCETTSVYIQNRKDHIFIPNAITPNDDGENDAFSIYSKHPLHITNLFVENEFQTLSIRRKNIRVEGTTEIWVPLNLNGNKVHGLFNYQVKMVDQLGDTMSLAGQFCSIDCKDRDSDEIHYPDCFFQSQSHEGLIDTSLLVKQNDCSF